MINRILFHKNILSFAISSILVWNITIQNANASVMTSIKTLGFISAAITDGVTKTEVLLPDGASEHNYSMKPSDVKRLQNAELIVWIGPKMETFLQKFSRKVYEKKQIKIASLEKVKPLLIKNSSHRNQNSNEHHKKLKEREKKYQNEYNMHLWLSPEIARLSAIAIHAKLVEIFPQNRSKLDSNLKDFEIQLSKINKQVSAKLAPLKDKGYFVFHDAYGYYEKYYGLTPLGHFTINPELQPGAQHLYEIKQQLIQKKAICIFTESQFKPAIIKGLCKGTSVRTGTLDALGKNIQLNKTSYLQFLNQLANQYENCLQKTK